MGRQHSRVGAGLNFQVKLEFGNVGFLRREENWSTRRKTIRAGMRTNNKLNSHMTPSPAINPRPHWWEAYVGGKCSTTVPSLLLVISSHSFSALWYIALFFFYNSSKLTQLNKPQGTKQSNPKGAPTHCYPHCFLSTNSINYICIINLLKFIIILYSSGEP